MPFRGRAVDACFGFSGLTTETGSHAWRMAAALEDRRREPDASTAE